MKKSTTPLPLAVLASLAAISLLTSCASSGTKASGPDRKESVIIGTVAVPQSLDPVLSSELGTEFTGAAMYEALVAYDAAGKMIPKLAASWKVNTDATAITVNLRTDVTFHSGNKLTAKDVVYTLDRIKKVGTGAAAFIPEYASATAVDDHTVQIQLSAPASSFIGALSLVYIVDSQLVAGNAGTDDAKQWISTHDAGSGPYSLSTYTANQQSTLNRFDGYWKFDGNRPKGLVYRYITDSSTLKNETKAGGVDVAAGLAGTDFDAFAGDANFTSEDFPSTREFYAMMNVQGAVTSDIRVREAIQLAYDYDGHLTSILGKHGSIASGLAAPNVACRVDLGQPKQDVTRAKALVQAAGAEGKTLTLAYQAVFPEHQKAATLLQSNLKAIGLNLELKTVTYPQYMSMIASPATTPDLGFVWDWPLYPEIGPMLSRQYSTQALGHTNLPQYSNPKVDTLLKSGLQNPDVSAACGSFQDAQRLIAADKVTATISNPARPTVFRTGVGGVVPNPGFHYFDPTQLIQK